MTPTTAKPREITMIVRLSDAFLETILATAYEGGIGYWARGLGHHQTEEGYDWIALYLKDEAFAASGLPDLCSADEVDDYVLASGASDSVSIIDLDTIALGLSRLLGGEVPLSPTLLGYIITDVADEAANPGEAGGEIDADTADCIVQAGLLGEVVYG